MFVAHYRTTASCPRRNPASPTVFPVITIWWFPATDTVADLPEGGAEDLNADRGQRCG